MAGIFWIFVFIATLVLTGVCFGAPGVVLYLALLWLFGLLGKRQG